MVNLKEKKQFLRWFLQKYSLKKRESVWILNYLLSKDDLMENVHFVRKVKSCPKGIMMSTIDYNEVPFRFYKEQIVTTDSEKAFHDIRFNQKGEFYIQLNFTDWETCPEYVAVLEENPFMPDDFYITNKDRKLAKQFLDECIKNNNKNRLNRMIDKALDEGNKELFYELSSQVKGETV